MFDLIHTEEGLNAAVEKLHRYIGALLIFRAFKDRPPKLIKNGTATFLNTGTAKLVVTASHVISEFITAKAADADVELAVTVGTAQAPVVLSQANIFDSDADTDIATLRMPAELGSEKEWLAAPEWPPKRAAEGARVIVIGYPSEHHSAQGMSAKLTVAAFSDFVTSNPEGARQFSMEDRDRQRRTIKLDPELKSFSELSGMSGGPAFSFDDDRALFSGVFTRSNSGAHATLFAVNTDCIGCDGSLKGAQPKVRA